MLVYIFFSKTLNRFYVGQTEDLNRRTEQHASQIFPKCYTKRAVDWKVFLVIPCESRGQAMRLEKHIKAMKSSLYIRNLAKYPELVKKLKLRFK